MAKPIKNCKNCDNSRLDDIEEDEFKYACHVNKKPKRVAWWFYCGKYKPLGGLKNYG